MDIKDDIRVIGSFQKIINSLYVLINALRIIGVVFLALQVLGLMFSKAE